MDAELLRRAQNGDDDALQQLIDEHLPGLRAYLRLRMGPEVRRWETVSDLAQSVCGELIRSVDGVEYRGDAAFKQWLFTMARRKIVEKQRYWKADKRDIGRLVTHGGADNRDPVADAICDALGGPADVLERRERVARIEAALDEMPELEREVILLTRLAGLTSAQVAERIERSESAVRNLLARALGRLSRKLG